MGKEKQMCRGKAAVDQGPGGAQSGLFEIEWPDKPLRPSQCRSYLQKNLAARFPAVVEGFLRAAEAGSAGHVKLATELLETPVREASRKKGSAARLLEKLERERERAG